MATHVSPQPSHRGAPGRTVFYVGVALLVVDVVTVLGLSLYRSHGNQHVHDQRGRDVDAGIAVSVVRVETSAVAREVTLPADVRAFNQTTLYAKVSGYLVKIAERGERVQQNELVAVLEAPETERDVLAARSDAATKERNAQRMRVLAGPGVVSQLDLDNAERDARVARETLKRSRDVRGYTELRAPFAGVVTARYADPGALLPAATGTTQAALPIVDLTDLDRLRIFVYVGQDAAPFVHVNDAVTLRQDEKANQEIPASVTRVAGALDPRTRTMEVEIDLDNRPWSLQPGTFIHATLHLSVPPVPVINNESLAVRDGRTVVTVVENERAHFLPVQLGSNNGKTTRVLQGLKGGETIGINVPVEVVEGTKVRVRAPAPPPESGKH